MIANQMVCIIAPPKRLRLNLPDLNEELKELLTRVGVVHFASIVLLPPRADSAHANAPSLLMELVVDDRLSIDDLVALLVQQGFKMLWDIYGPFCADTSQQASPLVQREWLQAFLVAHASGAHCGFVGARDRTVAQILSEGELYATARSELDEQLRQARDTKSSDASRLAYDSRAALARTIADEVARKARFRWAAAPVAYSFWRQSWMNFGMRIVLVAARLRLPLVAVVAIAIAMTAAAGLLALTLLLAAVDVQTILTTKAIFGASVRYAMQAGAISGSIVLLISIIGYATFVRTHSRTVTAFVLLVVGLVLIIVSGGIAVFRWPHFIGLLGAFEVLTRSGLVALLWTALVWAALGLVFLFALMLSRPFLGLPAVTALSVALLGAVGFVAHIAIAAVVSRAAAMNFGVYPDLQRNSVLGMPAADVVAFLVFAVFSATIFVLVRLLRMPPVKPEVLSLETEPLRAAHQVHPSIDECEALLVAKGDPNHLVSLTDIKAPYWLNRRMLRFFLWLIGEIGHTVFVHGRLANADGIRFAHWRIVDDGRRLLFCANYDGSFGGYLDEFINGAPEGINLIWRWTELRKRKAALPEHPCVANERQFPPTSLWILGGCKYEQWFKAYARDSMLPFLYRFAAYKYSAQDVERATRLREALFGLRTTVKDDQIMRALES